MLIGQRDYVQCGDDGRWSPPVPPTCQQYCRYPGRPAHGDSTTMAKDYYLAGERVVYWCHSRNYRLVGDNVLECTADDGKWSPEHLPTCSATL